MMRKTLVFFHIFLLIAGTTTIIILKLYKEYSQLTHN